MQDKTPQEMADDMIRRGRHHELLAMALDTFSYGIGFRDMVASMYLERGERLNLFHGYEDFCRAYALVPLGLSVTVREQMLDAFVSVGFHWHAVQLAEGLKRSLTRDEVRGLVGRYVKGAVQSDNTERELLDLAYDVSGIGLEVWARERFLVMRERWRYEGLLP